MVSTVPAVLPTDIAQLLGEFDDIQRATDDLLSGLDEDQFNWTPAHGAWSIGQCFDHLNVANTTYLARIEPAVAAAREAGHRPHGPLVSTMAGRWFIASFEPPVRRRMRAPGRIRPTGVRLHKAEVWPAFVRIHSQLRALLREGARVDLNRATFRNPFVGIVVMRSSTAIRVVAAHDRRHIWQATNVRRTPGFPKS
jgi:hypothetical protein